MSGCGGWECGSTHWARATVWEPSHEQRTPHWKKNIDCTDLCCLVLSVWWRASTGSSLLKHLSLFVLFWPSKVWYRENRFLVGKRHGNQMIGKGHGDHMMGKETRWPDGGEMRGNHLPSLGLGQGAGDGVGTVALWRCLWCPSWAREKERRNSWKGIMSFSRESKALTPDARQANVLMDQF